MVPTWMPHIGMKFNSTSEAWNFWTFYGGRIGCDVRVNYENKSKVDGVITSARYVCSNEGYRARDKRDHNTKRPRAETRTGCTVRMGITIDREVGNYEVHDLDLEHNHVLQLPATCHLMPSQRKISSLQAFEIETADDSGIVPKAAHELASRQVGGSTNLGYTRRDHKNYLRTKRQREMMYGEAGTMLKYFQDKKSENPAFQSDVQLDCEEKIANIFWADARMIIDYAHFGDVVTFDTTFGTNKEYRPFGVFVGFNHFRETVIFGAALLYDETFESFKWLFKTFLSVHSNKHPRTIFTDQDAAMGKAVDAVFTEAWHGLCNFHIMQNAVKHLPQKKKDEDGPNVLAEFSACMYKYEDEQAFEEAFTAIRSKMDTQTWLDSIYKVKEKWARCFMRNAYTLGMRSTQLSESLNSDLKNHLKSDLDILRFFKHLERVVQGKRDNELNEEYESRKKLPRVRIRTPAIIQASKVYTPRIFEDFQNEYERSISAYIKPSEEQNVYNVAIASLDPESTYEEESKVLVDHEKQHVLCSCGQFERVGILCSHALKALDVMNIKYLPSHYILKRWTREARSGTIQDSHGNIVLEDPRMEDRLRLKFFIHKFHGIASKALVSKECSKLVDDALESLSKQVEEKASSTTCRVEATCEEPDAREPDGSLKTACLKKKEIQKKNSRRNKSWIENQRPNKKKKKTTEFVPEKQSCSVNILHLSKHSTYLLMII
jgi:zinc finger SWIM domain-containing protein 3